VDRGIARDEAYRQIAHMNQQRVAHAAAAREWLLPGTAIRQAA
jgi:hypothetical protein